MTTETLNVKKIIRKIDRRILLARLHARWAEFRWTRAMVLNIIHHRPVVANCRLVGPLVFDEGNYRAIVCRNVIRGEDGTRPGIVITYKENQ